MESPSPLKPLTELAINRFRDVPTEPSVYVVFWVRDGKPVPIPRILGVDEKGVLYIGTTRSKKGLRRRIRDLWISVQMARRHIEGKHYPHTFGPSLVYTGLHNLIRDEELWSYFKEFSIYEAEYQEKRAILEYTSRYGEPPPLNLQVGRQYFAIIGLGVYGRSRVVGELDHDLQAVLGL